MAERGYLIFGLALIAISVIVSVIAIIVASSRALTPLESILFQVVALGTGLSGSFLFGRMTVENVARDMIRPYVRATFRRVFNLYDSQRRLGNRIEEMHDEAPDARLALILAVIEEQRMTGWDAMEDLRDIIPEDIDDMEGRYAENDDDSD